MVPLREVVIQVVTPNTRAILDTLATLARIVESDPEAMLDIHICPRREIPEPDYVKAAIKEKERLAP